jgi:hypothetical protein
MFLFSFEENECIKAANEYDFNTSRNRHFLTAEPAIEMKLSSESRRWLWIFLAYLAFLLAGIIAYCGCKQMLLLFYNRSFRHRIRTRTEPYPIIVRSSTKSTEPLLPKHENISSKKGKIRTQHLRLGSVDHPNRQIYKKV